MPRTGWEKLNKAPDFAADSTTSAPLRKRTVAAGYVLTLVCDLVIAGGSGAGAWAEAVTTQDGIQGVLHRIIRRLAIEANGAEKQAMSGRFLHLYTSDMGEGNHGFTSVLTNSDGSAVTLAAGTKKIVARFYIPQQMLNSFTPEEFGLPTTKVDDPELRISWGNAIDLFGAGTDYTTAVISNPITTLYELPYIDNARAPEAYQAVEIRQIEVPVVGSSTPVVELTHITKRDEIRALCLEAMKGGAGGRGYVYDSNVCADLRFVVDGKPKQDKTAFVDQAARNDYFYKRNSTRAGVAWIDAGEDGKTTLGDLYTVNTDEKPALELSVTQQGVADNKVFVTVMHVRRVA